MINTFKPKCMVSKFDPSCILATFNNEETFRLTAEHGVEFLDFVGVLIHPYDVKVGDTIGFNPTGFSKTKVISIELNKSSLSVDGLYLSGYYTFTVEGGFRSIGFDGIKVHTPLYKFIE